MAGRHGQITGQTLCIFHHSVPAAGHADAVHQHRNERNAHDHRLDEVGGGDSPEAAQNGIAHDDQRRHDHGGHVVHAEQAVEQLAAGRKAGRRVGHEEHDDDDRAQCVEQIALVMEPQGQELRHRDGVQIGGIAPQPPRHDEPVQPGAQRQTNGRPARGRDAGEIRQARHSHQQPAGHIAGFGAHGCDQRTHLAAAEVEVRAVLVGLAVGKAHQQHTRQIEDNGGNDADVRHKSSPSQRPFLPQCRKRCHYFTIVKCQSARYSLGFSALRRHFCTFVGIFRFLRGFFYHFAETPFSHFVV